MTVPVTGTAANPVKVSVPAGGMITIPWGTTDATPVAASCPRIGITKNSDFKVEAIPAAVSVPTGGVIPKLPPDDLPANEPYLLDGRNPALT